MKKLFLSTVGVLLFLAVPSLYAYNNQWSDNEDYVVPDKTNVDPGEGNDNEEVKGANPPICRIGSPVYLKSGHFTWSVTDIILPGRSGIYFSRSYTSKEPLIGMFGNGWISNLESGFIETVRHIDNNGTIEIHYIYRKENGLRYTFKEIGKTIESPSGMHYKFNRLSSTSYTVTNENKITDTYSNDLLISKEDANGNKSEYEYDENSVLQSIKDSVGNTLSLTFGGNGYVTAITDQNERTWQYDYDGYGNLVTVTNPLDGQRNYMYEAYQADNDAQVYYHLTEITDETDKTVTKVNYNTGFTGNQAYLNGRVDSYTVGENSYSYYWGYLSGYNEGDKTDSLGNKTEMYMLESGHIYKYKDPRGYWLNYNIDENMTLTGVTDKNGNTWNQSIDDEGRIVSKTSPLGSKTSLKYTGEQRVPSEITSALGSVTKITYDGNENPTTVTLPNNSSYKATYDTKGNVLETTNPSGTKISTVTYNTNSQPTSIKNALGDVLSVSYNTLSQMATITDAEGDVITYTYDILGNMTKTVNAMDHKIVYTYDATGRLISITDPVENITSYKYDKYGRLSVVTRPDGRTFTYAYNTLNQIIKIIDSAGRETAFEYDAGGNIAKVTRGDAWISYKYNGGNNLTEINSDFSQNGRVLFYYDEDGRLIRDWFRDKVDYGYDADGNLATIKVNSKTITYTRNTLGDITSLSDETNTFSFTYDEDDRRKSITYPNGLQTMMGYNAAAQLTSLNDGLRQNNYKYNTNGMLTQKAVDGINTSYTYDKAKQLTSAGAESYSYSVAGNILNDGATYDAKTNRLLSTNQYTLEYDTFGNLTKKSDKSTGTYKVYTWSDWDMLIKVESFDSSDVLTKKIEYTYDPSGRRDRNIIDGDSYTYDYYDNSPIAMYDNNGDYIWFLYDEGVDRPLAITNESSGENYFYHRDYLGSVTALSDSSGTEVESYTYDAYGKTAKSSSVETGNPFAYAGREMDDEDLYYYRSRYYDPTIGRFLSEDTIGFSSGDFNFYRYVLNNPVNYVDPYGHLSLLGMARNKFIVGPIVKGLNPLNIAAGGAGKQIDKCGKVIVENARTRKGIVKNPLDYDDIYHKMDNIDNKGTKFEKYFSNPKLSDEMRSSDVVKELIKKINKNKHMSPNFSDLKNYRLKKSVNKILKSYDISPMY